MAISISTYGTRDTDEAMKNSRFGDAENVVVNAVESENKEGDEGKEADKDKEEKPPEQKEEKSEKDDKKAAAAKADDKDEEDFEKLPKWAQKQIEDLRKTRRDARARARTLEEELETAQTTGKRGTETPAAADDSPKTYSGKPEPKLDEFTAEPDKYPDPYAALSKAYGMWAKDEAKAELKFEQQQAEQQAAEERRVSHYEETRAKIEEHFPDLDEVISSPEARKVLLSESVIAAIRESDVGPAVLRHLILNPEIAAGWLKKSELSQVVAFGKLVPKIEAEIEALIEAKKDEGKGGKKKDDEKPPLKTKSNAPAPADRLKPSGDGKQTAKDIAGSQDKHVSLIGANLAEYERKRRQEGYQP